MRRLALVLVGLTLLLGAGTDAARADGPGEPLDIVTLQDQSVLRGRIVAEDDERIVLETGLGRLEIPREQIVMIERRSASGRHQYEGDPDPDTNTIFFTPTPETLGDGGYFRNFLLFFLNTGFALHEDLDLSVGTIFPVASDLASISAGLKWRVLSRAEHPVGVALVVNGTIIDDYRSGTFGAVAGIGDEDRSLNVAVGRYAEHEGGEASTVVLAGADVRVGPRMKFLIEYGTSSDVIDSDVDGLINVGFRWFGDRMSFTLTGFRPLEDTGDFVVFPFTMFSLHF